MTESTAYSQLLAQVKAGEVYLDDEVAAYFCFKACDKRLADLRALDRTAALTQRVSGFGDFVMGRELEAKFRKQATGEPNSIDAVIAADVEVVTELREVFALSFKRLTGQDVESANAIKYAGKE
ncbi:hypothetical protein [Nocardia camponoti]|uniref:Uncharacterized protein n=1 Tax=Nocardia camponoti TaxID=1616106 RepID=A0A917QC98_9NOCA|nr:hypothetical protein [Nocardia camponoti]GGK40341.1 hypothetical protein GCM10011591_09990 [Nocardia camponoti]